ncbi:glycosyltransferase family 8 protein [Desarmillaria tabescens]|uniref:Glycosyltransferase family 8 protein n=1 Tax=Armillaria tabescens TaxID=1929756 RepID=A0AA39NB98_ARMTA|nr:glycosyltransferase family 8 protein [Desarmillaria tabescens]KAK0462452.1 glycosyltransferase family 8 protein [Desarmillaria tabescens]
MTPDYHFTSTQDWFSGHIPEWRTFFCHIESLRPRVLEIGAWEGRSAVFLLTELCKDGGELVTIDHFDLMQTADGRARHEKVLYNLRLTGKNFRILDQFSVPGLMQLLREEVAAMEPGFDWIYVDGSHRADDTFLDGELVWRLARKGAVIVFDDYEWGKEAKDNVEHPKRGIDGFLRLHDGEYERLSKPGDYQMIIRKVMEMRIGFLLDGTSNGRALEDVLGYGINLAIVADSEYAMAASVAIRTAVKNVAGRCTVYIYDCGLTEEDKSRISYSIPTESRITHVFIPQHIDDLSFKTSPTWAKLDLMKRLPVERALYLDSDTLVRGPLLPLWNTDLQGKSLGAVLDVGFPKGHETITVKEGYFNAGVLLLDLAKIRLRLPQMPQLTPETAFKDQDYLNLHFEGDWITFPLRYNAQGLGTYAKISTPERNAAFAAADFEDPVIVHFTGPVSPPMAIVLNPWVQPYTAKPWGYAGAPGHPYAKEWWDTLKETAWKGIRESEDFRRRLASDVIKVRDEGGKEFERLLAASHQLDSK